MERLACAVGIHRTLRQVRFAGLRRLKLRAHEKVNAMSTRRKVEIFSAGCPVCEETIQTVNVIACPSCDVSVFDTNEPEVAARAKAIGVRTVPAVSVEGELVSCCTGGGPDERALRTAGIGQPIS